jgi:hypothetical protein
MNKIFCQRPQTEHWMDMHMGRENTWASALLGWDQWDQLSFGSDCEHSPKFAALALVVGCLLVPFGFKDAHKEHTHHQLSTPAQTVLCSQCALLLARNQSQWRLAPNM